MSTTVQPTKNVHATHVDSFQFPYCALGPTLAASTKLMCIFDSTSKRHAEHLPCQLTRRQKHDSRSLCAIIVAKKLLLYVRYGDFSRLYILQHVFSCAQWGEARNACFWDPKNRPHVGHVCQSLGFGSQDSMRWAETSAAWDWRPRVAGARMVLAETSLFPTFLHHFSKNCHFTTVPAFLGFWFN